MRNAHTSMRKLSGKKMAGTKEASYPAEERFNPDFIKEVEQSIQDVKDGKGIKFKTADDLFDHLKK